MLVYFDTSFIYARSLLSVFVSYTSIVVLVFTLVSLTLLRTPNSDQWRQILVTARDGLKAACERERTAGRLRLEAYKRQSGEEIMHLEGEQRRLRAGVARLQT